LATSGATLTSSCAEKLHGARQACGGEALSIPPVLHQKNEHGAPKALGKKICRNSRQYDEATAGKKHPVGGEHVSSIGLQADRAEIVLAGCAGRCRGGRQVIVPDRRFETDSTAAPQPMFLCGPLRRPWSAGSSRSAAQLLNRQQASNTCVQVAHR